MEKTIRVGILRETKNPPDRRVALTPPQIVALEEAYPHVEFFVQPCSFRCYSNEEYEYLNIPLKEDLRECDILLGVKEVNRDTLIPGKTYLFFAHVAKEQPHNRELFRQMAEDKISLVDYEYLTTDDGQRVVAFGRYAGIVGAYNGLRARGIRTNRFNLKPAHQCRDLDEMWAGLRLIQLKPGLKILITGGGRVANGAIETLNVANIVQVNHNDFLSKEFDVPVFCQIGPEQYVSEKSGKHFDFTHFSRNPKDYESAFLPYTSVTDILIAGHYWDPHSPRFFSREDMRKPDFRISVIADISCDINGAIPSTLRPTTISDPFYGYNPYLAIEEPAFMRPTNITVMSIDNLPGELPRDASRDFGNQLIQNVMNDVITGSESKMIARAKILSRGQLTNNFAYLKGYLHSNS